MNNATETGVKLMRLEAAELSVNSQIKSKEADIAKLKLELDRIKSERDNINTPA